MPRRPNREIKSNHESGNAKVAVVPAAPEERTRRLAVGLARELSLPIVGSVDEARGRFDLVLIAGGPRLELRETGPDAAGPIYADFVGGATGYRVRSGVSRRQPLALAVGLRHGPPTVVDATAGLGRDAFHLASLGCTVTAVERSPILGALLRDGLERAKASANRRLAEFVNRIHLVIGDAREVLPRMAANERPDVVYLDPMYAPRKKSTLVEAPMRICRRLVGDDIDAGELFEVARRVAGKRIVVKRHRHAPPLSPHPTTQHRGTTVRYDVYAIASMDGKPSP